MPMHATTVEDRILTANREVSPYGVRIPERDAPKNSVLCMKRSCPKRIQLELNVVNLVLVFDFKIRSNHETMCARVCLQTLLFPFALTLESPYSTWADER
jgi:hypothetical protein